MKTNYNITNDGDNTVYLDINIINDSSNRIPASFTINRSSPIIPHNPEEYMASVVRFTVPLTTQPLFIFFKDVNIVSISYNGTTVSSSLLFQRTEFNNDTRISQGTASIEGGVYSYQTMADMVNVAIKTCCDTLGLTPYPYMTFDSITTRFSVYFPTFWADTYPYTDVSKPKLFLNKLLQTYFVSFNNISYDNALDNKNLDYLIICSNTKNNFYTDTSSATWYYNIQEWDSLQYINSLSNISIVSSMMPCVGDNLNNNTFQSNGYQSGTVKVITDFEVEKSETASQRSLVQYQSQNNRYIDLVGQQKIYNLDFGFFVYYQELLNQVNTTLYPYQPLLLNPYEVITLKVMFKRKSLNY